MSLEAANRYLRESAALVTQAERLRVKRLRRHAKAGGKQTRESQEYRRRIDQNLAEITDKLNGLIGYVAGHKPPPAQ